MSKDLKDIRGEFWKERSTNPKTKSVPRVGSEQQGGPVRAENEGERAGTMREQLWRGNKAVGLQIYFVGKADKVLDKGCE